MIAGAVLAAWPVRAEADVQRNNRVRGEQLAAFFAQVADGIDQKAVAAQAAKIERLQDALKACGSCGEKNKLTAMLAAVRGTPAGTWREPADMPGHIPERDVIAKMRAEGVAEDCIAFYRQYTRCERASNGNFAAIHGPCPDDFRLYEYCRNGNAKGFADVSARRAARAQGAMVPRIDVDAAYFGKVPGWFNPPIPPPSYMAGRRHIALMMRKDEIGALVQVWLKPLSEYLYYYVLRGKGEWRRRELTQDSLDKIAAMERAAAQISDAYVIECGYTLGDGAMRVSSYWWGERPDAPPEALETVESGGRAISRHGTIEENVIPIFGARTRCPDQW